MIQFAKKIVLSSKLLTSLANRLRKWNVARKYQIRFGKNVFIGYSTIFEGKSRFGTNSSVVASYIGYATYIADWSNFSRTRIGRYSSIGPNVTCILGKHPANTFISTHPAFFSINHPIGISYVNKQLFKEHAIPRDKTGKYSIVIGNDVWIGANVAIMDGIVIGDGAIVAANALVTRDVSPYTIVDGVPAKPIKKRFKDDEIEFLLKLEWWNKPNAWIVEHAVYFDDIKNLQNKLENG